METIIIEKNDNTIRISDNWIRVKDRLPPQDGSSFLGFERNESESRCVMRRDIHEKTVIYVECIEGYEKWKPTHWMPLPEPPSENGMD